VQELLRVTPDCDRDSVRFSVRQTGLGFCHLATRSCFGDDAGLGRLHRRLLARRAAAPQGSFTARLFADRAKLAEKIAEEAAELNAAASAEEVIWEAADLLYFTLVRLAAEGIDLADVERHLDRRERRVRRRD
jgi:phosphoribosyl-ATP pyrophosphohydrolase